MTDERLLRLGLGARLRALRERRGLSPEALAERSGIDVEALAACEEGRRAPAIGELARLAAALEVDVGHFFARAGTAQRVEIVRAQQRWDVQPPSEAARTLNYRYQSLSYHLSDKLMSPFLVEIPPGPAGDVAPSRHEGEEFLFVLSGQLEVSIAGELHRLGPGDALYFHSDLEHSLRAVEGTSVRLVACIAQPAHGAHGDDLERAFGHGR